MYYGRDDHVWNEQINKPDFKQHSTKVSGEDAIMLKARKSLNVNYLDVRLVCACMGIRRQWETILYDLEGFDVNKDMSYAKTYYVYKSPPMAEDRDFLLEQHLWMDFPEPGMFSCYMKSIKDERFPEIKGRTRATA